MDGPFELFLSTAKKIALTYGLEAGAMKSSNGLPPCCCHHTAPVRRAHLLAAFERSGLSAAAFARQQGIAATPRSAAGVTARPEEGVKEGAVRVGSTPALSRARVGVSSGRMAYLTMEASIDHGRITVAEPDKLPVTGKALLTLLESPEHKPDWGKVMGLLGTTEGKLDGLAVEREARAEWDECERKLWGHR